MKRTIRKRRPRRSRSSHARRSTPGKSAERRALTRLAVHRPPAGVRRAAAEGLELHRTGYGGRGLTPGAIHRARLLAKGAPISEQTAVMMRAWFARHAVDRRPRWAERKTPGFVAWQLWGGDAARAWVQAILR